MLFDVDALRLIAHRRQERHVGESQPASAVDAQPLVLNRDIHRAVAAKRLRLEIQRQ